MNNNRPISAQGQALPNLYLVGFMGTGKSALGRRLAQRFGMRFIDSDAEIEKKAGMSVQNIFSQSGEDAFRGMEREFVEGGHPENGCVVACGGGLVCREGMPELLRQKGVVVVLFADPMVVLKRVAGSAKRPLLNVDNPLEKICALMKERQASYEKSGVLVSTVGRIEDTEERIARIFQERIKRPSPKKKGPQGPKVRP